MAVPVLGLPTPPTIPAPPEAQHSKRSFSLGRHSGMKRKFLTWSSPKPPQKPTILPEIPAQPVGPFMCVQRVAPGVILRHSPGIPQLLPATPVSIQSRRKGADQERDCRALFPPNPPPEYIRRSLRRQGQENLEEPKRVEEQQKEKQWVRRVVKMPSRHSVCEMSDCEVREVLEKLDLYWSNSDSQDRPELAPDTSSQDMAEAYPEHGAGPLGYLRTMRMRFKVMRQVYRAARKVAALEEQGQVINPHYRGIRISGPLPMTEPEQDMLRARREEFIRSQKSPRDSGYMECSLSPSIRRSLFVAQCSGSLAETPTKPPQLEAQRFSSDETDDSNAASSDSEAPTKSSPWRDSMQKAVEDINAKYQEYIPGLSSIPSPPKEGEEARTGSNSSAPSIKIQAPEQASPAVTPLKPATTPAGSQDSGRLMVPDNTRLEGPQLRDRIVEIMRECLEPNAASERPHTRKDENAQQQQMCFCSALQVAGKLTSPCEKCRVENEVPLLRL